MPALNFKKQFIPKILSLEKRSTIRGKRKNPILPGDTLKFYTGMRTKQCELIGTAFCSCISAIWINEDAPYILNKLHRDREHKWYRLAEDALKHLCNNDGFANYDEMKTFFRNQYGLPFIGELIEWKDFKPAQEPPMMGMSY